MRRLALIGVLVLDVSACERDDWKPATLAGGGQIAATETLIRGREGYQRYCVGCHGAKGDGQGPAARFLDPRPRDFTQGIFKFAAVPGGSLPHDDDLHRTLKRGLMGTSMPSWRLLPEDQRDAIVQYLKTFSKRWATETPPAPIAPTEDPWASDPKGGIAEGRRVYHARATCWSCHAAYARYDEIAAYAKSYGTPAPAFRPNLYRSDMKVSDWGTNVWPPEFVHDTVKSGSALPDLYRIIASGIGGTAMPTWRGALPESDLWAMAHYVKSLADLGGTPKAAELVASLIAQGPPPAPAEIPGGTP